MKHILLCCLLLGLSFISIAQINSVGKTQNEVIWDLLGREDTISRSIYSTHWTKGDTLVVSVYRVLPDTLNYHPLYYFVNDICVHQRIIRLRQHTWPSGCVNTVVDKIEEYDIAQLCPNQQPSSYYPNQNKPNKTTIKDQTNIPTQFPKSGIIILTNQKTNGRY